MGLYLHFVWTINEQGGTLKVVKEHVYTII